MSTQVTNNNGMGAMGLLGVVFVTLKLLGIITWSWWYVTMPFWGSLALAASVGLVFLLVALIVALVTD